MTESRRTPASGERAAVRGFRRQYEYSACMIYKLMQDNAFEWLSVSDDDAGIFDDLLLSIDSWYPLYKRSENKILCVVSDHYFGDLRNPTLTLCPYLVDELGWQRSQSNPFEIYDNEGNLMAYTLRWVDGTDHMASGGDVEFFGFGQFVLLNPVARKALEDRRERLMLETKLTQRVELARGTPIERILNSTDSYVSMTTD